MLSTNFTVVPRVSQSLPDYKEKKEANVPFPLEKVKILFINPK